MSVDTPRAVKAVLGPTNTGKTYLAIDRMLGHQSGMIGFPLRLLARENYDRVVRLKGAGAVALITGEERIVPPNPRYFLCTVEAMPRDREVDFLAIDEIQLCADPERGHVFTDRLLHARGRQETMFMGAETMAPILRRLVPEAEFERRERFSRLGYGGYKKITRLPPRSAVIAFSAANVYALAELMRRQRGGTAVVLGALSPRTRNAQVAMYEAGEVEYLVATDAIGMGLNMGIDHVAFSSLTKFDGHAFRRLSAPEVAQIAGRAGRHMADGTFGPTAELEPFEPDLVEALEGHNFDPVRALYWRSGKLDFSSLDGLKQSLDAAPPAPELRKARAADDYNTLLALKDQRDIREMAGDPGAVQLLWDVCQIPDFRADLSGAHPRLVSRIYRFLRSDAGTIPSEWIERSISRLDRVDGDIDTLMSRIAGVRTWTYISHRKSWLEDAEGWQERARKLEDKLSDALHESLTSRFVDRKTAALVRRLREKESLLAGLSDEGRVTVEGEEVGNLEGFRFVPVDAEVANAPRLMAAANRALREAIGGRVAALTASADDAFALDEDTAHIRWRGAPVGRVVAGPDILRPAAEALPSDLLDAPAREAVRQRLQAWLEAHLRSRLAPLYALSAASLTGVARGLAFRLVEGLGCAMREREGDPTGELGEDDRKAMAQAGVRMGIYCAYLPALLKGRVLALKAMLYRLQGRPYGVLPDGGATAVTRVEEVDDGWYLALGFRPSGPVAVRADELERLMAEVRRRTKDGGFALEPDLLSRIDAPMETFVRMLRHYGYAVTGEAGAYTVSRRARAARGRRGGESEDTRKARGQDKGQGNGPGRGPGKGPGGGPGKGRGKGPRAPREKPIDPDSPFAKLAILKERAR